MRVPHHDGRVRNETAAMAMKAQCSWLQLQAAWHRSSLD